MSDDLIVWLRAALDEDERVADEAPWHLDQREWPFWVDVDDERDMDSTCAYRDHFTPARALAEVAAKRRLLDLHPISSRGWEDHFCRSGQVPCQTVRLLALSYADRLGYQEGWRP